MNWFRKIMIGRYGVDQFNIFLLGLSLFLTTVSQFSRSKLFYIVTLLPMLYCLFRMFSKRLDRRSVENRCFLAFWFPIQNWVTEKIALLKHSKNFKHFKCPNCSQKIRVPRGKGKVEITCPACHQEFIKKT